jgi:mono/diheme cytochrome c family protein
MARLAFRAHGLYTESPMRAANAALTGFLLVTAGCTDVGPIREWRASDHDQPEGAGQVEAQGAPAADDDPAAAQDVATEVLWRQQCARCHGRDGSGGMAMAANMPVPDLRRSAMTEAEVVEIVSKGRRQMPAFGQELEADAITALARKVVALRR